MTQIQRNVLVLAAILAIVSVFPSVLHAAETELFGRPSESVVAKGNEVLKQVTSETKTNLKNTDAWP